MGFMSLKAEDASDWSYRGEGAVNLVLAYTGTSPDYVGKVIRIQKVPRDEPYLGTGNPVLSEHEQLLWTDIHSMITSPVKEVVNQLYVECVIIPLLGSEFVDAGVRVCVSKEFLESVERNVSHQRPSFRVNAAQVDILADSVHLMSDLSLFPNGDSTLAQCISVEIKPKWGFLPYSKFIAEHNAVKRNVTRFKMHQALKMQESEISELSNYDPLDLFSGSKDQIRRAVSALFATPQNNLRVFLNGSIIHGGFGSGKSLSNSVNRKAFEEHISNFIQADEGLCTTNFIDLVTQTLFESPLLDRLLQVQKLDDHDIEGAIHAYYNVISQPCAVCRDCGKEEAAAAAFLHSMSVEESVKIVKDYLISATAKDCCLMISFRASRDGDLQTSPSSVYLKSTNQSFDYKAYFIDLDMKPLKKMEYHYKLDQKIVRSYNQLVKKETGLLRIHPCAD